mgnify:CR=1 FL=1
MIKTPMSVAKVAWVLDGVSSFFTGQKSDLTKETLKVLNAESNYSNDKIISELNYEFLSLDETIKHCINFYVEKYQ